MHTLLLCKISDGVERKLPNNHLTPGVGIATENFIEYRPGYSLFPSNLTQAFSEMLVENNGHFDDFLLVNG